tara:strand:- start:236 stop:388 length:153 start_codon:yes stop_codon:yes gene_type:complete
MAVTARSVAMNEFVIAFIIGGFFILGFWLGVSWYRNKMIQEALDGKTKSR